MLKSKSRSFRIRLTPIPVIARARTIPTVQGAPAALEVPIAVPVDIPRSAMLLTSQRRKCAPTVRATNGNRAYVSGDGPERGPAYSL